MEISQQVIRRIEKIGIPKTKGRDLQWFLSSAISDREDLEKIRPLRDGDIVIDIGCGYGRLAAAFAGTEITYLGVDVHPKRADYASTLFDPYPNVTFIHLDYRNDRYNPGGLNDPETVRIGLPTGKVAAIAAVSVFTHMPDERHVLAYLREFCRLLGAGGTLLTTWLTQGDPAVEIQASRAVHRSPENWLNTHGLRSHSVTGAGTVADHLRIVSERV